MSEMISNSVPPALPPRKSAIIQPSTPVPLVPTDPIPLLEESEHSTPPPLPPRGPRQLSSIPLAPALDIQVPSMSTPAVTAPPEPEVEQSRILRPISVEITPATPQMLSPATPIAHPPPRIPFREPPQTIIPMTDPTISPPTSELPEPPQTAPPTLAGPHASVPPPLPRRPHPTTSIPISVGDSSSMVMYGMITVIAVLIAYTRILPLWLLLAGLGGMGWKIKPVDGSKEDKDEETERVLSKDKAEMRHAVGWVNHLLYALFPLISTDVLTPFIDLLEDALIQQIPPIVTSVRLEAPALGSQPLLLTSMRAMTDEEWFASVSAPSASPSKGGGGSDTGVKGGHRKSISSARLGDFIKGHRRGKSEGGDFASGGRSRSASGSSVGSALDLGLGSEEAEKRRKRDKVLRRVRGTETTKPSDTSGSQPETNDEHPNTKEEEESGQYVNFQIGFEYKRPDSTKNRKGYGLHVLGYFGIGVKGLGRTELPIYIDMLGIKGILNIRILLSATPPFARTATITFPKLPEFDISAKPLTRSTFNAMSLPGMNPYVQASIADVARTFVRPQSYTLDVDRLLLGRKAAFRTASVGVLHIIIHSAEGLPKVDTVGTCDPYVAVGFAKYHKPMFSTRTIIDNQNPTWEEPAFVLVTSDEIESGESLRLRICDADRFSADDAVGIVEVELADLIAQSPSTPNSIPIRRTDNLRADKPGMRVSGSLTWSVRFAPLWKMSASEMESRLKEKKVGRRKGDCTDNQPWYFDWIEKFIGEKPDWVGERDERRKETTRWFTGERERDELEVLEKPSHDLRSGVLQFHIHQCTDLEVESLEGTYSANSSARKSAAGGRPALGDIVDRTAAENPEPPSSYVEVHLNDRMVFRTRTKQVTPLPYFNAVSERFLRDWRAAKLVFVVRDERDREHDPILGIVTLRLEEAFREGSQFTRWYPLVGGLGWGHIRISLLWKPIDIQLPPRISAFEIATLEIKSVSATDLSHLADKKGISILLETEADKFVLSSDTSDNLPPGRTSLSLSNPSSPARPSTIPDLISPGEAEGEMEWDITRPIRLAVEYRHSCSVLLSFITRHGVMRKKRVVGLASVRLNEIEDNAEVNRVVPIFATSSVKDAIVAGQVYAELHSSEGGTSRNNTIVREEIPILGFVSIGFLLRPGVSKAHRKLAKKDLRFNKVYEAWEADKDVRLGSGYGKMMDDDEISSDGESDSDGEDGDEGRDQPKVRRTPSGKSVGGVSTKSGTLSTGQLDGDESDEGFIDKRRAHSKALHKRHKGIFQLKVARTGKFVKDMVEAKLYARASDRRIRGADLDVEQEGQSRL